MKIVCLYILYFLIYAFIGWLMEVICKFIQYRRYINRGFLIGPICPIYGYGVLAIILINNHTNGDILAVFLKSILVCSVLEYFTSYIMEKLFHARWWDYSQKRFNINGRICLETMLPFGILGTLVVYLIHPLIETFLGLFSEKVIIILGIILFIIYLADIIVSLNVMNKIKSEISRYRTDNTELIRKKVMKWLGTHSNLYRHIKEAYPKFIIYNNVVNKIKRK